MKLALVTPRYGGEIATGAEYACRLLAEQLSLRHDVEVLTTTARDKRTWKSDYTEGADRIRGVLVRRFAVNQPHEANAFRQFSDRILNAPRARTEEMEWVRRLGPSAPGLVEHLKRQQRAYDALVFFSLIHWTTVHGIAVAPERSILFPCLRLGPILRFDLWREMIASARAIGLVSGAERKLLHSFIGSPAPREELVGVGIDPSHRQAYPRHQQDPADEPVSDEDTTNGADGNFDPDDDRADRGIPFRRRHRLYGPMVLYGGRIEPDNGCEEMLEYFDAYAANDGETALVLMGVKMMKVPDEPYVRQAGVLPDRERMVAYEAADVTIAPGSDDPLALSVLESFAVGTPVLACARNAAAVEHCRRAGAGLYYANRQEFVEALRTLMSRVKLREQLGKCGRQYVRQYYRWDAVLGRFERLVTLVRSRT
jgi:glycosyltransferase involved in cell wall biosynthesis